MEPATPNPFPGRHSDPPQAIEVEGEEEYEVDMIVDSKIDKRFKSPLRYYVKWLGYEGHPEEYQWLSANDLDHSPIAIEDFHKANPTRPGPLSELRNQFPHLFD